MKIKNSVPVKEVTDFDLPANLYDLTAKLAETFGEETHNEFLESCIKEQVRMMLDSPKWIGEAFAKDLKLRYQWRDEEL